MLPQLKSILATFKTKVSLRNSTAVNSLCLHIIILLIASISLVTPTATEAKNIIESRLKTHYSPADLLKEYSETPLPVNTSIAELESNIFSWTGAKISAKKIQHHQLQQIQHQKRSKTKKNEDVLIANNIEFSEHMTEEAPLVGSSVKTSNTQEQRKKHKPNQQQRKRNGQQQRQGQKLHRNGLRLLSSKANTTPVGGLFPPLFNVAPRATISVNATCGQSGREEYCKLVDAYPHKKWATQCGVCNAHSSDITKRRPIESVISTISSLEDSWWQSPALQYGRSFEYVTVTIDLKQGLLSLPHSSACVVRIFSIQNIIKSKCKNKLALRTCAALIQTKDLVRCNESSCYSFDAKSLGKYALSNIDLNEEKLID